jgi:hypothetical protein
VAKQKQVFINAAFMGEPAEKPLAVGWRPGKFSDEARNGGLNIERVRGYDEETTLVRFA